MSYTNGLDDPTLYFNTKLYTGDGTSSRAITGVGFQPDWVWIKNRTNTFDHNLFDAVRGAGKLLESNTTDAETTVTTRLLSFNSDGFTTGANSNTNQNTAGFVSWNWLAGGTASSNTDGSITSTVSANQTAGFSIVKWVASGSNPTVGHGLGVAPKMIILKTTSVVKNWVVGHDSIGWTKNLYLHDTDAQNTSIDYWNNTAPTSTVFSLGNSGDTNDTGETIIAYCFAEKKGYSKFGSYTGNGNADGTFVYTGFKPAFVLQKCSSIATNWTLADNKRSASGGFNEINFRIGVNENTAEENNNAIDFLSNGFKCRQDQANANGSGETYIYMAFASNPFVTSTGVPATAR